MYSWYGSVSVLLLCNVEGGCHYIMVCQWDGVMDACWFYNKQPRHHGTTYTSLWVLWYPSNTLQHSANNSNKIISVSLMGMSASFMGSLFLLPPPAAPLDDLQAWVEEAFLAVPNT